MTTKGRVLVAGAGGVIGRVLCRLLLADGWQVIGTTRRADRVPALKKLGVQPVVVDVFDAGALRLALLDASPVAVIHQLTDLPQRVDPAGLKEALERNAKLREVGTRNLIDACLGAGVERVVAQSIAFAYAPGPKPIAEGAPLHVNAPDPVAARSARAVQTMERLVLSGPFQGLVLRYGRLYGPGTWTEVAPKGGPVHVDAAADAARRALLRGEPGIYNVAEADGWVSVDKATRQLGWSPTFRCDHAVPISSTAHGRRRAGWPRK